jgi:hypothetical protein
MPVRKPASICSMEAYKQLPCSCRCASRPVPSCRRAGGHAGEKEPAHGASAVLHVPRSRELCALPHGGRRTARMGSTRSRGRPALLRWLRRHHALLLVSLCDTPCQLQDSYPDATAAWSMNQTCKHMQHRSALREQRSMRHTSRCVTLAAGGTLAATATCSAPSTSACSTSSSGTRVGPTPHTSHTGQPSPSPPRRLTPDPQSHSRDDRLGHAEAALSPYNNIRVSTHACGEAHLHHTRASA